MSAILNSGGDGGGVHRRRAADQGAHRLYVTAEPHRLSGTPARQVLHGRYGIARVQRYMNSVWRVVAAAISIYPLLNVLSRVAPVNKLIPTIPTAIRFNARLGDVDLCHVVHSRA
jgi:hypothetical protein